MTTLVLIIPDAQRDKANRLGEVMGYGPDSYSIALSASGNEPATHWGSNIEEPDKAFLALLQGAAEGHMPEQLIQAGYAPADFGEVMGALIVGLGEFADVMDANKLKVTTLVDKV